MNTPHTAIFVKTESCDSELFLVVGKLDTDEKVQSFLEERLGDEVDYISELMVAFSDEHGNIHE